MTGHRGALTADFQRFYGLSLSRMKAWGIPLSEVADLAAYLPPESATRASLDEHWQRTPELDLLRNVEHSLRVLTWQNTQSAQKGIGYPEPMPLPWDPEPEGTIKGDRMTLDEAAEWLGWDTRELS